jgi:FHS family Na+ dependent glucose MFS transporter 1
LPGLARQTGTQLGQISVLFVARSLGGFAGAILAGRLYDRRSGHPVLATTLGAMALALFLIPFIPRLGLLSLLFFFLGISEGNLDVGTNTLIVWVHGRRVGPYMNGLHFFFGVGAFVSPIIIAQVLLRSDSVAWGYWILALLALPVLAWYLRLPSPSPAGQLRSGNSSAVEWRLVALIALFLGLYVGAEVSFGGWIYSYAVALDLASEATAAYLTSAFWGAFTLGRLISIPLAAYLRPRTVLIMDLLGALLSAGVIVIAYRTPLALWIGTIAIGLTLASIFPTVLSLAERRMPITGRVTSWFFVGASLGAMILPWLMGQLFSSLGPQSIMSGISLNLLAGLLVLGALLWYSPDPDAS